MATRIHQPSRLHQNRGLNTCHFQVVHGHRLPEGTGPLHQTAGQFVGDTLKDLLTTAEPAHRLADVRVGNFRRTTFVLQMSSTITSSVCPLTLCPRTFDLCVSHQSGKSPPRPIHRALPCTCRKLSSVAKHRTTLAKLCLVKLNSITQ